MLSERTIERLSEYRRYLMGLKERGLTHVYSHVLAVETEVTAAQVRRDMMNLGLTGSTSTGYQVDSLLEHLGSLLDHPLSTKVALIGTGNLGRSLLAYFKTRPKHAVISMAFDSDPEKCDRVLHGCRVYHADKLKEMISREGLKTAIICVPAADANCVAGKLVDAGITGIVSFAPVKLKVPDGVFVHVMDITTVIEKVGFFAVRDIRAPGWKEMVAK